MDELYAQQRCNGDEIRHPRTQYRVFGAEDEKLLDRSPEPTVACAPAPAALSNAVPHV